MKPEELEIQGGTAQVTSQGIAGKLRGAGLWYDAPKHSVVDGDAQLEAHRKDIETQAKQANFFGSMSRYLWFAALPVMGVLTNAIGTALEGSTFVAAIGGPVVGAALATAAIIGAGFWAAQKATSLGVSNQFETSMVNARATAQEIAKQTGKENTVVVQPPATHEPKGVKWANRVGHQEPANKNASYVERYAPEKAAQQSHTARAAAEPEAQAASIV